MALLAAIAALTWISVNRNQPNINLPNEADPNSLPGYYVNEAVITVGGADGTPLYQLEAEKILHQPADKSVLLSGVKFDYLEQQGSPWELRAKQGQISDNQEVVKLFGDVRLVNRNENSETATVVTTASLDILPASYVATTKEAVVITHGQYEITAVGMAADLNQGKLKLQSQVHGHFTP